MKILTIVIPSYNTESFIDKNMRTFLDERLYEKVEVLIINDGSKDRTAEVAKKYEDQYSGYIRLINKENGGHGSVINLGIKEAQGKYFKVIDADDWVNTENLVRLVLDLEQTSADVVINPHMTINQITQKEAICDYKEIQTLLPESSFELLINRNIHLVLHSITYRTSILRENHIEFTEKCFYEDWQYDLYPVPYLKTVTVLDYPVYWYLIGQKAQSVDAKNALKNVEMSYKVIGDAIERYSKVEYQLNDPSLNGYVQDSICEFIRSIYNIYLRNYKEKDIDKKMIEMDKKIKLLSSEFYSLVGEKNRYITLLRLNNRVIFFMIAVLLKIYKSLKNIWRIDRG